MRPTSTGIRSALWVWASTALVIACYADLSIYDDQEAQVLPVPSLDIPPAQDAGLQTAVLAGGCFWSVEAVFEHVKGVVDVVTGFSGGSAQTAHYELVSTGATGHAESVRIVFDPKVVSYGQILRVFFSVAHDPTQIDRQGPDYGKQYRSNVFHGSDAQRDVARSYIDQLGSAGLFPRRIATRVDPLEGFYPAEDYHQDFVVRNLSDPYVLTYSLPKLDKLRQLYPELYRVP